jgi:hypothetical protein
MSNSKPRATKRHLERRRKRGLKRVEVPARDTAVIRRAAAVLRIPSDEVKRLRVQLGFGAEPGAALTALEVFAMEEPPSPEAEALWHEAMEEVTRDRNDATLNRVRNVDL